MTHALRVPSEFDPEGITDLFRYRYLSCYDGLREGRA